MAGYVVTVVKDRRFYYFERNSERLELRGPYLKCEVIVPARNVETEAIGGNGIIAYTTNYLNLCTRLFSIQIHATTNVDMFLRVVRTVFEIARNMLERFRIFVLEPVGTFSQLYHIFQTHVFELVLNSFGACLERVRNFFGTFLNFVGTVSFYKSCF